MVGIVISELGIGFMLVPLKEVLNHVLQRYHDDFRKEGLHSYDYKMNSGRMK